MQKARNITVEIISALLIIFFVYNSIAIFVQLQSLKNLLAFYTVHTGVAAWTLWGVEVFIAVLLFVPGLRRIGLAAALLFFLFAGYMVLNTPGNPHDFGGLLNNLSSYKHIVLDASLAAMTGIALYFSLQRESFIPIHNSKTTIL